MRASSHTPFAYGAALAAAAVLGVLGASQMWVNMALESGRVPFGPLAARHVGAWSLWGLAAPTIITLARRWPVRGPGLRANLLRHALVGLAFAALHRPFHVWFAWSPYWGTGDTFAFVRDYTIFSLFSDVAIYWLAVSACTVVDQRSLLRERDLHGARLAEQLARAELRVLEQQLRPHFLFNTLHALRTLQVDGRVEEATTLVEHLAGYLRIVLAQDEPPEVPLREELQLAQPYLDLMALRYADRLETRIDVGPEAADGLVPRLLLQPLLENAFLHGVDRRGGAASIEVRGRLRGEVLELEVIDDGEPLSPVAPGDSTASDERATDGGLGLDNVRDRLRTLHGDRAGLELETGTERGTVVRVHLPWRVEVGEWEPVG